MLVTNVHRSRSKSKNDVGILFICAFHLYDLLCGPYSRRPHYVLFHFCCIRQSVCLVTVPNSKMKRSTKPKSDVKVSCVTRGPSVLRLKGQKVSRYQTTGSHLWINSDLHHSAFVKTDHKAVVAYPSQNQCAPLKTTTKRTFRKSHRLITPPFSSSYLQ